MTKFENSHFNQTNLDLNSSSFLKNSLKAIDLFAGIGGIRLGFQEAFGKNIEFVFSSEIDKYAKQTYYANFGEVPYGDITKIDEKDIPPHDIILAGFPCQAFSIAGKRLGFEDTRGTLFFDVARIATYHKPKLIFLENVKGFLNHDKGNTFKVVKQTLEDLGYKVYSKVLNAKDFGVPQNRERIYIVAFLDNVDFDFPNNLNKNVSIHDMFEIKIDDKYYYNNKPLFEKIKDDVANKDSIYQWRRKYVRENKSGVCPTLTANMGTGGHNVPIIKDNRGIRKLTPKECLNFQGFPRNFKLPNLADGQLYKQAGNSVVVEVIKEIAKSINCSFLKV
ncbi:DNA cytosine methyltransferase [Aliarcobacter skirrowii]|nr:DNA cytosine methyltransferase [Aliarcobacter skirrowii]MDX4047986.1 DNA cytosine methyltransferase [Aliarcobacter skirrowii]